jgi:hypothetical protein
MGAEFLGRGHEHGAASGSFLQSVQGLHNHPQPPCPMSRPKGQDSQLVALLCEAMDISASLDRGLWQGSPSTDGSGLAFSARNGSTAPDPGAIQQLNQHGSVWRAFSGGQLNLGDCPPGRAIHVLLCSQQQAGPRAQGFLLVRLGRVAWKSLSQHTGLLTDFSALR